MSGQRDDQATGLLRWLSMALRVWTLVECVVRRQLAAEEATGAGRYAGHAQRATARPTAARFREALQEVPLTVGEGVHRVDRPLTVSGILKLCSNRQGELVV